MLAFKHRNLGLLTDQSTSAIHEKLVLESVELVLESVEPEWFSLSCSVLHCQHFSTNAFHSITYN
jgi:hypothetical protein